MESGFMSSLKKHFRSVSPSFSNTTRVMQVVTLLAGIMCSYRATIEFVLLTSSYFCIGIDSAGDRTTESLAAGTPIYHYGSHYATPTTPASSSPSGSAAATGDSARSQGGEQASLQHFTAACFVASNSFRPPPVASYGLATTATATATASASSSASASAGASAAVASVRSVATTAIGALVYSVRLVVSASFFVGEVFGGLFNASVSDSLGRNKAVILASVVLVLLSLCWACVWALYPYVALLRSVLDVVQGSWTVGVRALAGGCVGVVQSVMPVLAAESMHPTERGRMVGWFHVGSVVGTALSVTVLLLTITVRTGGGIPPPLSAILTRIGPVAQRVASTATSSLGDLGAESSSGGSLADTGDDNVSLDDDDAYHYASLQDDVYSSQMPAHGQPQLTPGLAVVLDSNASESVHALIVAALGAAITYLAWTAIPESPFWLLANHTPSECMSALRKFRGSGGRVHIAPHNADRHGDGNIPSQQQHMHHHPTPNVSDLRAFEGESLEDLPVSQAVHGLYESPTRMDFTSFAAARRARQLQLHHLRHALPHPARGEYGTFTEESTEAEAESKSNSPNRLPESTPSSTSTHASTLAHYSKNQVRREFALMYHSLAKLYDASTGATVEDTSWKELVFGGSGGVAGAVGGSSGGVSADADVNARPGAVDRDASSGGGEMRGSTTVLWTLRLRLALVAGLQLCHQVMGYVLFLLVGVLTAALLLYAGRHAPSARKVQSSGGSSASEDGEAKESAAAASDEESNQVRWSGPVSSVVVLVAVILLAYYCLNGYHGYKGLFYACVDVTDPEGGERGAAAASANGGDDGGTSGVQTIPNRSSDVSASAGAAAARWRPGRGPPPPGAAPAAASIAPLPATSPAAAPMEASVGAWDSDHDVLTNPFSLTPPSHRDGPNNATPVRPSLEESAGSAGKGRIEGRLELQFDAASNTYRYVHAEASRGQSLARTRSGRSSKKNGHHQGALEHADPFQTPSRRNKTLPLQRHPSDLARRAVSDNAARAATLGPVRGVASPPLDGALNRRRRHQHNRLHLQHGQGRDSSGEHGSSSTGKQGYSVGRRGLLLWGLSASVLLLVLMTIAVSQLAGIWHQWSGLGSTVVEVMVAGGAKVRGGANVTLAPAWTTAHRAAAEHVLLDGVFLSSEFPAAKLLDKPGNLRGREVTASALAGSHSQKLHAFLPKLINSILQATWVVLLLTSTAALSAIYQGVLGPVALLLGVELFPLRARSRGAALSVLTSSLCCILFANVFGKMVMLLLRSISVDRSMQDWPYSWEDYYDERLIIARQAATEAVMFVLHSTGGFLIGLLALTWVVYVTTMGYLPESAGVMLEDFEEVFVDPTGRDAMAGGGSSDNSGPELTSNSNNSRSRTLRRYTPASSHWPVRHRTAAAKCTAECCCMLTSFAVVHLLSYSTGGGGRGDATGGDSVSPPSAISIWSISHHAQGDSGVPGATERSPIAGNSRTTLAAVVDFWKVLQQPPLHLIGFRRVDTSRYMITPIADTTEANAGKRHPHTSGHQVDRGGAGHFVIADSSDSDAQSIIHQRHHEHLLLGAHFTHNHKSSRSENQSDYPTSRSSRAVAEMSISTSNQRASGKNALRRVASGGTLLEAVQAEIARAGVENDASANANRSVRAASATSTGVKMEPGGRDVGGNEGNISSKNANSGSSGSSSDSGSSGSSTDIGGGGGGGDGTGGVHWHHLHRYSLPMAKVAWQRADDLYSNESHSSGEDGARKRSRARRKKAAEAPPIATPKNKGVGNTAVTKSGSKRRSRLRSAAAAKPSQDGNLHHPAKQFPPSADSFSSPHSHFYSSLNLILPSDELAAANRRASERSRLQYVPMGSIPSSSLAAGEGMGAGGLMHRSSATPFYYVYDKRGLGGGENYAVGPGPSSVPGGGFAAGEAAEGWIYHQRGAYSTDPAWTEAVLRAAAADEIAAAALGGERRLRVGVGGGADGDVGRGELWEEGTWQRFCASTVLCLQDFVDAAVSHIGGYLSRCCPSLCGDGSRAAGAASSLRELDESSPLLGRRGNQSAPVAPSVGLGCMEHAWRWVLGSVAAVYWSVGWLCSAVQSAATWLLDRLCQSWGTFRTWCAASPGRNREASLPPPAAEVSTLRETSPLLGGEGA